MHLNKPINRIISQMNFFLVVSLLLLVNEVANIESNNPVDSGLSYLKTSLPQPARAVNILGLRSLAGFNGAPQFQGKAKMIADRESPMVRGYEPLGTVMLFGSVIATIAIINNIVPTI